MKNLFYVDVNEVTNLLRGEPGSAVFATTMADAHLHYVITEYFIPELAKITGCDLGFHFDDLIHLKLVLGLRSRYGR